MTPAKTLATASEINAILREVCARFLGQQVAMLGGGRRMHRQRIAGTVIGTTSAGVLVAEPHGRTLIAYADLYARHVEILGPGELADAVDEGLHGLRRAPTKRTLDQAIADVVDDMQKRGTTLVGMDDLGEVGQRAG